MPSISRKNLSIMLTLALLIFMSGWIAPPKLFASGQWTDTGSAIKPYHATDLSYDSTHNVLYAGTFNSAGVWRCDNPNTAPNWVNTGGSIATYQVGAVVYDETRNVLYAGTWNHGVWRCDNPNTVPSWTSLDGGSIATDSIGCLEYDPVHNIVFAGGSSDGLWRCQNPNTSPSWSSMVGSGYYLSLGYDSIHNILYTGGMGQFKRFNSPNTSNSPTDITGPLSNCYYISDIVYDGKRNLIYSGGSEDSNTGFGMWRCNNPDTSGDWTNIGAEIDYSSLYRLAYDQEKDLLYAGTKDDGVARCINPESSPSWTAIGKELGSSSALAYDGTHGVLYAGYANGVSRYDSECSFFFAEGYTGSGFEEWLCLMNPNGADATAHITYMFQDGTTKPQDVAIGATSRATVDVNQTIGPDKNVSIRVSCSSPIIAERPMYFNYKGKWTGGHDVMGAQEPQTVYYFAEGYTGAGFEEWLCLMNPNPTPTTAHVSYMFADGTTKPVDVGIGATSRATVDVNQTVGPDKNVSIKIASDAPIVAERPMYFNYKGKWTGGHDVMRAQETQNDSYFAEGYTGSGFEEWLCLMNPNQQAATAKVNYLFSDGTKASQTVGIGATSRATVDVNAGAGPNKNVSIYVQSDQPILAERPMYFNYKGSWAGGHDVVGSSGGMETSYFAEGYTGQGFEEWLCLLNDGFGDTTVHITYMFADGTTKTQEVPVKFFYRATVDVNAAVGPNKNVSIMVQADTGIVVERPMYFNYKGKWAGGHDVMGTVPQ